MFDLTYIGHAGWLIKNKDCKILCDPWLNPAGAFFSAWFPFPDNSQLFSSELIADLDLVYISHSHQDHYDPWTLNQIDKTTTILIPKFKDGILRNKIKNLGFSNIVELSENEDWYLKNIKMNLIIDDRMIEKDSGLLLDDGVNKILNLNDCHPDFDKVKMFAGEIDMLLVQSSSAIWWPCVYEYDEETMKASGQLKRENAVKRAIEYSHKLNPRFVVPNAGPPVFLYEGGKYWDDTRRESFNPFILHDEIAQIMRKNEVPTLFVVPGSQLLLDHGVVEEIIDYKERDKIYKNLDEYMEAYRKRRQPHFMNLKAKQHELDNLVEKFSNHIRDIKTHSKIFTKKVDFPFLIDFQTHGKWIIDFSKDTNKCITEYTKGHYNYCFKFEPDLVALLFREEHIDFEDYFLSMRFTCNREVDQFNEFLFAIFKNFDLKRLQRAEFNYLNNNTTNRDTEETFDLVCKKGRSLIVKRYCPHRGVDLKECAYINQNNELVCPLHGWKFDLENGECTNNTEGHNIFSDQ